MISGRSTGPSPIVWGLFIGFGLIVLISMRACSPDNEQMLRSRFAATSATQEAQQASGTPAITLPEPVQSLGQTTVARFQGGQSVIPSSPTVSDATLKVDIKSIQQVNGGLEIKGVVTNVGKTALRVPLSAFRFTDQNGTVYASQGDAAATLPPGGNTPLELTLPIQNPTSLQMVVDIPDAKVRLEMKLLG